MTVLAWPVYGRRRRQHGLDDHRHPRRRARQPGARVHTVTLAPGSAPRRVSTLNGVTDAAARPASPPPTARWRPSPTPPPRRPHRSVVARPSVTFTPGAATSGASLLSPLTTVTAERRSTATVTLTLRDAQLSSGAGKTASLGGAPAGSTIRRLGDDQRQRRGDVHRQSQPPAPSSTRRRTQTITSPSDRQPPYIVPGV